MNNNKKLIPIGLFKKLHGLNGEIKVFLYNKESKTIISSLLIWIYDKKEYSSFEIENVKGSKENIIIKLKGIHSREQSRCFLKKEIFVLRKDFPKLNEGFYLNDVIGFNIVDINNNAFGILEDVIIISEKEILVFKYLNKEILIPKVDEFVKLFDLKNKIIIIDKIEQFIE